MAEQEINISSKEEYRRIIPYAAGVVILGSIIALALDDFRIAYSVIVGVIFSGIGFRHLANTQQLILQGASKKIVFLRYLARMGVYAFPVILAIQKNTYFNLLAILISLFTFQVLFVLVSLRESLKRVQETKKN